MYRTVRQNYVAVLIQKNFLTNAYIRAMEKRKYLQVNMNTIYTMNITL